MMDEVYKHVSQLTIRIRVDEELTAVNDKLALLPESWVDLEGLEKRVAEKLTFKL
ncbi:unnamed protein product [Fusarium venenatum]|uniref:Uncharacterized protein n=1 Tax=Fusarium venenatum TaxID=56646 RepID=A0A2L2TPV2_9HYPO|nr:uncharacterized protein FVRRES_03439 [Fusarium venenatum]CEI66927.1 unnamed protein product [Fusarium venenatum]